MSLRVRCCHDGLLVSFTTIECNKNALEKFVYAVMCFYRMKLNSYDRLVTFLL